jgi:hypothetical protein
VKSAIAHALELVKLDLLLNGNGIGVDKFAVMMVKYLAERVKISIDRLHQVQSSSANDALSLEILSLLKHVQQLTVKSGSETFLVNLLFGHLFSQL